MSLFLGFDTSNYTTSIALYNSTSGVLLNKRRFLYVKSGEKGLRQSDAVFQHVKNLPLLIEDLLIESNGEIAATAASARPRDIEGSYMPCFEPGCTVARAVAATHKKPFYSFSHQAGHIVAVLFSINRLDLLCHDFVTFHVSGGTTEAILCSPGNTSPVTQIICGSLDLKAGQAVDRVGLMLGLSFPAGPKLEELAVQSSKIFNSTPTMKGLDCCLSGIENRCCEMLLKGAEKCDIAQYCIEYIKASIDKMTELIQIEYPNLPLVFAGGVMSNSYIREYITTKYGAFFAKPEYSSDNAAGIAVLAGLAVENK